jgi:hypothetical protein
MFPDGTGGLASWAEAETIEQARPVSAAAVRRVWRIGDFMGLVGRCGLALTRRFVLVLVLESGHAE